MHEQNAKYLAYALSTESVKKQKKRLFDQGPAIANIRIDQLLKLKIPLPPLKQQEKIAKW
ncbi:restriction endonuclease subunit S, partial [Microbacterium esteraromaticum]